jgi:hypothetical protein
MHEQTLDIDLGLPSGKPVTMRIDVAVTRKNDGAEGLGDYKTTSTLWGTFGDCFSISPQMETYVLGMRLAGVPIKFAFVEGILVSKTKVETLVVPLEYSEDQIAQSLEWWKATDGKLHEQEVAAPGDPLAWPMNRAMCTPYPGFGLQGFVCEYQPLCQAGARWQQLLGLYTVKRHDEEGVEG